MNAEPIENENELAALPLELFPLDTALPYPIYIQLKNRFIQFRARGDSLSASRVDQLRKHHVDSLLIRQTDWAEFTRFLESRPVPKSAEGKALWFRHLIIAFGREVEHSEQSRIRQLVHKLFELSDQLCSNIAQDPGIGNRILRRSDDPAMYFLNHIVNAALYANLIGRKLAYKEPEIRRLTFSVLVHDIGNLYLPKAILHSTRKLTPEEWKEIQRHTELGADLLQACGLAEEAVLTAAQHHEKMDGTGYPSGLKGTEIHPFARICAICDVYDALTSRTVYREALSAQQALTEMTKMTGHFDGAMLSIVGKSE